jgi:hypothetical protein
VYRLGGVRRSSKRWMAPGAVVLLAGAGYLVWWMCQPPALHTIRLRDGARLSLGAVTSGKTHLFDPAPPLLRPLRRLSDNLTIAPESSFDTNPPETVAWLHLQPGPRNTNVALSDGYVQFQDEHGCPFERGHIDFPSHADVRFDQWVTARPPKELANEHSFWLRGFYLDTRREAYAIHIVTPASGTRPKPVLDLKAKPLPQTFSKDGFTAVLKGVSRVSDGENSHDAADITGTDTRFPGARWSPVSLAMEDRFGRRSESIDPWWRSIMKGEGFAFFGLCRKEPAWKLTATLARDPWSPGLPDQVWDVPEATMSRDTAKRLSLRHGARELVVSQPSRWRARQDSNGREQPLVRVSVSVGKPWRECRLVVTHVNGVKTSGQPAERRSPDGSELPTYVADVTRESGGRGRFFLPLAVDANRVRLRIGEYEVRRAEFVVKPPELAPP